MVMDLDLMWWLSRAVFVVSSSCFLVAAIRFLLATKTYAVQTCALQADSLGPTPCIASFLQGGGLAGASLALLYVLQEKLVRFGQRRAALQTVYVSESAVAQLTDRG